MIDEAASKLRLEMNSVPDPIDELNRKIRQLEIEREAIKREGRSPKLDRVFPRSVLTSSSISSRPTRPNAAVTTAVWPNFATAR